MGCHPTRPLSARTAFSLPPGGSALSLLEVLVAMTILLAGAVAVVGWLPTTLRQNERSADATTAVYIAQMKAEEIRRDDSFFGGLISAIEAMTTGTLPATFPLDTRFAYSFSGETVLYPDLSPADPRCESGVARVIIRYDRSFRPNGDLLYELRFK
jgi:type II secretory pathway pseudopilin PulG